MQAQLAAEIYLALKAKNQLIEFRDILIAASALEQAMPLLTLNTNHFARIDGFFIATLQ